MRVQFYLNSYTTNNEESLEHAHTCVESFPRIVKILKKETNDKNKERFVRKCQILFCHFLKLLVSGMILKLKSPDICDFYRFITETYVHVLKKIAW